MHVWCVLAVNPQFLAFLEWGLLPYRWSVLILSCDCVHAAYRGSLSYLLVLVAFKRVGAICNQGGNTSLIICGHYRCPLDTLTSC